MNQITLPRDVAKLGTILSVWAHPDDETYSAAGILSAATRNDQDVVCVTATKGEAGVKYAKPNQRTALGEVRAKEMKAAMKVLGIEKCHWLGCADGCCCDEPSAMRANQLAGLLRRYRPDTILTFGPEGWTGHEDHKAVSRWVSEAVASVDFKIEVYHLVTTPEFYQHYLQDADKQVDIFFNIDEPPQLAAEECAIYLELTDELLDQKIRALQAMPSQTDFVFKKLGVNKMRQLVSVECFAKQISAK